MKHTLISVRILAATLITFGSLAGGANGALTVNITEMDSTSFSWNITGDFSDLPTPTSGLGTINILFYDTSGLLMTTINPGLQGTGPTFRSLGQLNGVVSYAPNAWGFVEAGGTTYGAPVVGNTVDRWVLSDGLSFSNTDVITTAITSNGSGSYTGLNWTGFGEAVAVWGNNPIPAANIPEPSSVLLLGLGACGILARRRKI